MATPVRKWKKQGQFGNIDLTLPSGNVALVRRLQPEAFLISGLIPDVLSDMVHKAIKTKKGLPPDAVEKLTEDPKKLTQALKMMDEVLCYVVMEPPVEMPPRCGVLMNDETVCNEYVDTDDDRHNDRNCRNYHIYMEDARDEDTLYADEVSMEDKQFIFQFSTGGTADVERFREEISGHVANVPNGKAVQRKTKRSPRNS